MGISILCQWGAAGLALVAAVMSFFAATLKSKVLPNMPKGQDGDMIYQLGPNQFLYDPIAKRAKLNFAAGIVAVVAAFLQVFSYLVNPPAN